METKTRAGKPTRTGNVALRILLDNAPIILLILLFVVFALIDQRLCSYKNVRQILIQAAPIAILALGEMVVLIAGGIDLAVGQGVGLCSVVLGLVWVTTDSLPLALAATLVIGVSMGLFNGVIIAMLRLQPFIVTLALQTIIQGLALAMAVSVIVVRQPHLRALANGSIANIPNIIWFTIILILCITLLLRCTSFGLRCYAIGSNMEASMISGIPVRRQQMLCYVFSGVCMTVSAIMLVSRASVVSPNIGGNTLMTDAITATVIGGTSIYGGRGMISGTIVGAVIVSLISYSIALFGVSAHSINFYKGLVIILALVVDTLLQRLKTSLD